VSENRVHAAALEEIRVLRASLAAKDRALAERDALLKEAMEETRAVGVGSRVPVLPPGLRSRIDSLLNREVGL
jgi:hypothetical protein